MRVSEFARNELGHDARLLLLGHSMGGLVALGVMLDHPEIAREAVLSGPALRPARSARAGKLKLARKLRHVAPFVTTDHGIPADRVCSAEEVVSAYVSDPLVHRRISARLIVTLIDEGERIRAAAGNFAEDLSVLLLQGEDDRIARADDTQAFAAQLSCRNTELQVFPGMRHEVFNERERDKTFETMDRFLGLEAA
jgi:alpha-beta hydrolase superfamily lysophospholipase